VGVSTLNTSLKVVVGSVKPGSQGLLFQCTDGENPIACSITSETVDVLTQFHGLDVSKDESFDVLLREIERIANKKYNAGRIEQSGDLAIRIADLLRYGFQDIEESAA
jgi:hypothetical protein